MKMVLKETGHEYGMDSCGSGQGPVGGSMNIVMKVKLHISYGNSTNSATITSEGLLVH
jgi:hypothetical protein